MRQDITFSKTKPKILQKRDQCGLCYDFFSHEYELNPLQLKLIIDVALYYDKADDKMFSLTQTASNANQVYVVWCDGSSRPARWTTTSRR